MPDSPPEAPRAVVLLSGGLDSATCLAIAADEGYAPLPLAFCYGQRHDVELDACRRIARSLGAPDPLVLGVDLAAIGGSALTTDRAVPTPASVEAIGASIPPTYVPARNTVFLSLGLALAEAAGADAIYIGVNAVDFSGYPDCRPAFIEAFQTLADVATAATTEKGRQIRIEAPLLHLTKGEIIRKGLALGVDYGLTHSCYNPGADGRPCGRCDSCLLRAKGFAEAGIPDPALARSD